MAGAAEPPEHAYPYAAAMLAYCLLGADAFGFANGDVPAAAVEARIEAALDDEDESFDSRMILLAMHARLIQPSVVERFGLDMSEE